MVRTYKKKEEGARKSYATSQTMADAYNSVMCKQMSANQASKHYGVDKKALLRRVRGEIPVNSHPGRQTALTPEQEEELADCLIVLAEWGWGFSKEEVKDIIQEFVKENDIEIPFVDGRPSRDWLCGFMRRHPKVVPRKTEHLSNARAKAEDPEVIKKWFQLLEKTLQDAGVSGLPSQIFNCDETGFVTDPKTQVVLAEKGADRVTQSIGGSGREQVTVNCACSASGQVLPPYVVYKGINLYCDWVQGGPDGAAYTTSKMGWMESPQFLDWFHNIFLKNTKHLESHPRVLIFDGHASHVSLPLIESAKKNNVILLRLPSHLTHLLQPLDTSVFRPVKSKWQSLLLKYARTHYGPVSKKHFPGLLRTLFQSSFTVEQVKSGFRGTGIFPLNKDAIDTSSFRQCPQVVMSTAAETSTLPTPTASTAAETSTLPTPTASTAAETSTLPTPTASCSTQVLPSTSAHNASASTSLLRVSLSTLSTAASSSAASSTASSSSPSSSAPAERPQTPLSTSSSGKSSIRDFFLKELQPRFAQASGRGRSARVIRFRYGESLTGDECLKRLREEAAKKDNAPRKKTMRKRRNLPDGDDSDSDEGDDDTVCLKCGIHGGQGEEWVCCDLCDVWYHVKCTEIPDGADIEAMDWICENCLQTV